MTLIDGVKTRLLRRVPDERGFLTELLRSDWEESGFKAVGDRVSAIMNFPTELYNYQEPDEFRIPPDSPDIPCDWAVKLG